MIGIRTYLVCERQTRITVAALYWNSWSHKEAKAPVSPIVSLKLFKEPYHFMPE